MSTKKSSYYNNKKKLKKKTMQKVIYLVLIINMFGCKSNNKDSEIGSNVLENKNIEIINVNPEKAKPLNLSDIYSELKLIKLETNSESLLGEIKKMLVDGEYLYFVTSTSIGVFDSLGNNRFNINSVGNGPEEYQVITDATIDMENKNIIIYDSQSRKIMTFSNEGKFIDSWSSGIDGYSFEKLNDSIYPIYIGSSFYNENSSFKLNFINKNTKEISSRFFKIRENETYFLHLGDLTNFSKHENKVSFLYSFNDTIFYINEKIVSPRIYIDFGDKKLPSVYLEREYEDIREFLETCKETEYAFRIIGFFETDSHIVFSFMHKKQIVHTYYNKQNKKTEIVNQINDDIFDNIFSSSSSFSNLPKASSGNKLYSIVDSYELIRKIDLIREKLSIEDWRKFEMKNEKLISIYSSLKIDDNPIIIAGEIQRLR